MKKKSFEYYQRIIKNRLGYPNLNDRVPNLNDRSTKKSKKKIVEIWLPKFKNINDGVPNVNERVPNLNDRQPKNFEKCLDLATQI